MTGTTIGVTTGCILALMLAACDGDSGSGPSPALDVSPNAVTLAPGDPAVRFTATLTDAEGPVSWTLNGVGTLSASSGTITDYTPPASIAAGSEARVTATAGALTKQATITLDQPSTLTVDGAVVDGCGQPSPAARVWIRGKGLIPVDAAGHFTASDVTAPYDLAVITGPDTVMIAVYASIGRSDPRVFALSRERSGTVQGTVTDAGTATGTNATNGIAFTSPDVTSNRRPDLNAAYTLAALWCGGATVTGSVHYLGWTYENGVALDFAGYGVLPNVTLTSGGLRAGQDFTAQDVGKGFVSGSITLPDPSYDDLFKMVGLDIGRRGAGALPIAFVSDNTETTTFSYPVPDITGVDLGVTASASDGNRFVTASQYGIRPNTPGITLALPLAPTPITPADKTTSVDLDAQVFHWTPFTGGLHVLAVASSDRLLTFELLTNGSSAVLPPLDELGIATPSAGTKFDWNVTGLTDDPLDTLLDPARGTRLLFPNLLVPETRRSVTATGLSEARTFDSR